MKTPWRFASIGKEETPPPRTAGGVVNPGELHDFVFQDLRTPEAESLHMLSDGVGMAIPWERVIQSGCEDQSVKGLLGNHSGMTFWEHMGGKELDTPLPGCLETWEGKAAWEGARKGWCRRSPASSASESSPEPAVGRPEMPA